MLGHVTGSEARPHVGRSKQASVPVANQAEAAPYARLEAGFIDHWAGLAQAFGMDPMLGRVHAFSYLRCGGVDAHEVGRRFGIAAADAERYLQELATFGVVSPGADGAYVAAADPWSWFLGTLRQRGRREFAPLLSGIRQANERAQELRASASGGELQSIERIARFTQFADQIAGLLETFASLGAGPMLSAMRMVAKMRLR